jgi:hypothetical protein
MYFENSLGGHVLSLGIVLACVGCQSARMEDSSTALLDPCYKQQIGASKVLSERDLQRIAQFGGMGWVVGTPDGLFVLTSYEGEAVEVGVISSENTNSVAGVRHMGNSDWTLALECFDRVLQIEPEDHVVIFASGVCHEKLGDEHLVLAATERQKRRPEDIPLRPNRAEMKAELKALNAALAEYSESLQLYRRANYLHTCIQGDASVRRLRAKADHLENRRRAISKRLG